MNLLNPRHFRRPARHANGSRDTVSTKIWKCAVFVDVYRESVMRLGYVQVNSDRMLDHLGQAIIAASFLSDGKFKLPFIINLQCISSTQQYDIFT